MKVARRWGCKLHSWEGAGKRIDAARIGLHTPRPRGVVAQLVEHHNGIVGVISSILFGSTMI